MMYTRLTQLSKQIRAVQFGVSLCGVAFGTATVSHAQAVRAWGSTDYGLQNAPSGAFSGIACGDGQNFALRADGTAVAWGFDGYGVASPPAFAYQSIAAGTSSGTGLLLNGTLIGWGVNANGQASPPPGQYKAVSVGGFYGVAIDMADQLVAWGSNGNGEVSSAPSGTFLKVDAAYAWAAAIRTNGALATWGANGSGQQLNVPTGTFIAVSAGREHGLAIRTNGTLAAWGRNDEGQCNVPAGTFKAVAAGHYHSLAIRTDGTIAAWGWNGQGQLNAPSGRFSQIAAGGWHSLALEEAPCSWTTVSLHPIGATYSGAYAAADGQIVGRADYGGGYGNAALWTGLTASTYVDMSPPDVDGSEIWDVANGVQIGSGTSTLHGYNSAGLWKGDAGSWSPLPPGNQNFGTGAGTDGLFHVGATKGANGLPEAALWSGPYPYVRTSLQPANALSSFAWHVANGIQVGEIRWLSAPSQSRATVWYGSADLRVDIHPAGADYSEAYRTDGTNHVGWVVMGGDRAALWTSNTEWTDLTPTGYDGALAYNLGFGHQVGNTYLSGSARAAIWSGTAESFEDLHDCLPAEFADGWSYAWDIDVRGGKLIVVGEAYNTVTGQTEAVIWMKDLPADTDSDGLTDLDEINIYQTDPNNPDTDGDGLNDGDEVADGTNPLSADTDGDGVPDGEDPTPTVPGVTKEYLVARISSLQAQMTALPLSTFSGPSWWRFMARSILTVSVWGIGLYTSLGNYPDAIQRSTWLIGYIDDWMVASVQKDQIRQEAALLKSLLQLM